MKWLLRLVFVRLLGRRAVPILAILGLIGAVRRARTPQDVAVEPTRRR